MVTVEIGPMVDRGALSTLKVQASSRPHSVPAFSSTFGAEPSLSFQGPVERGLTWLQISDSLAQDRFLPLSSLSCSVLLYKIGWSALGSRAPQHLVSSAGRLPLTCHDSIKASSLPQSHRAPLIVSMSIFGIISKSSMKESTCPSPDL